MKKERRALRARPGNLVWEQIESHSVKLSFDLDKGVYATALLRELGEFSNLSVYQG